MMLVLAGLGAGAAVAVAGVAVHVHATGRRSPRWPDRPVPVVVLGAKVHPDGRPSDALEDRVRRGVALVQSGRGTLLLVTGGSVGSPHVEADVMHRLALALGLDDARVVRERESRSTHENALRCAPLLRDLGAREVLLVSCDFHLARASASFRRAGLRAWPVPSPRKLATGERLRATLHEVVALLRRPRLLWPW